MQDEGAGIVYKCEACLATGGKIRSGIDISIILSISIIHYFLE